MTNKLTPEQRQAAVEQLIDAYTEYLEESTNTRTSIKARYEALAAKDIEREVFTLKTRLGRAIASNPLPVRDKQRITKSTNWSRYRDFLEASGEVDISSREGRRAVESLAVRSELLQNPSSQKPDSQQKTDSEKEVLVREVTEKIRSWEHYDGVLKDPTIEADSISRWFETEHEGYTVVWLFGGEGVEPVFKFEAGDTEWGSPERVYGHGKAEDWADHRLAVTEATLK